MHSCEGKAKFSASLLQSSVSHDPSEIILICWFCAQETWPITIIIINTENITLLNIFLDFFSTGFFDALNVRKNSIFFFRNVSTFTFNQFAE